MTNQTTDLERRSLEAHVDLCSQRYRMLEQKLDEVKSEIREDRRVTHERIDRVKESVEKLQDHLVDVHAAQSKTIVGSAIAIIVALLGGIFALITNLN